MMNNKAKPTPKPLKGEAAAKQWRKETSPQGVAAAAATAKKLLEQKYPGLYLTETRTTPGVRRP